AAAGADDAERPKFREKRRSSYILTGKVFCASCGGALSNIGRDYLACAAARRQEVCTNRRGLRRQALEDLVLDAMRTRLMERRWSRPSSRSSPPSGTGLRPSATPAGPGRRASS